MCTNSEGKDHAWAALKLERQLGRRSTAVGASVRSVLQEPALCASTTSDPVSGPPAPSEMPLQPHVQQSSWKLLSFRLVRDGFCGARHGNQSLNVFGADGEWSLRKTCLWTVVTVTVCCDWRAPEDKVKYMYRVTCSQHQHRYVLHVGSTTVKSASWVIWWSDVDILCVTVEALMCLNKWTN